MHNVDEDDVAAWCGGQSQRQCEKKSKGRPRTGDGRWKGRAGLGLNSGGKQTGQDRPGPSTGAAIYNTQHAARSTQHTAQGQSADVLTRVTKREPPRQLWNVRGTKIATDGERRGNALILEARCSNPEHERFGGCSATKDDVFFFIRLRENN